MKLDERSGNIAWSFFFLFLINEFLNSVKTTDRQQAKYFQKPNIARLESGKQELG